MHKPSPTRIYFFTSNMVFFIAGLALLQLAQAQNVVQPPPNLAEISSAQNLEGARSANVAEVNLGQTQEVSATKNTEALSHAQPNLPSVRIYHKDKGASIEEMRVRGETQEIIVNPAGRFPAYKVRPKNNKSRYAIEPHSDKNTNGARVWEIYKF